jgi:hypothetical protein
MMINPIIFTRTLSVSPAHSPSRRARCSTPRKHKEEAGPASCTHLSLAHTLGQPPPPLELRRRLRCRRRRRRRRPAGPCAAGPCPPPPPPLLRRLVLELGHPGALSRGVLVSWVGACSS